MPVFIAAEAGVQHLGDRAKMLAFCDAAKACGADAVKFQAYNAEALIARRGIAENAMLDRWNVRDLLRLSELTNASLDAIAAHCKAIGFKWFASVFDPSQVERVLSRGACALKIGHKEAAYRELCEYAWARSRGVPIYGSNMHTTEDCFYVPTIDCHCVAEYPASSPPRLRRIWGGSYKISYGHFAGFSSHYTDYRIPAAAALRGAEYIEFHLKLSDQDPEAAWSLSVEDATKCCKLIREYSEWL